MSERRFVLVDFTHRGKAGRLPLYEAGHTYALPRAVAHAATKRELVAKQRPPHWAPPSILQPPEVLTRGACARWPMAMAGGLCQATIHADIGTMRMNTLGGGLWSRKLTFRNEQLH
jgi:hypothetical protein